MVRFAFVGELGLSFLAGMLGQCKIGCARRRTSSLDVFGTEKDSANRIMKLWYQEMDGIEREITANQC